MPASPPYTSEAVGTELLRINDRSLLKLYFLQILDRTERSRYEWDFSARSKEETVDQLKMQGIDGVGFACIFPHIAKVFLFGSSSGCCETNLYVRAFQGDPLQPISLECGTGMEVACAGEMDLAAKEFSLWRRCRSVGEYLDQFVIPERCGFENHLKLKEFLGGNG